MSSKRTPKAPSPAQAATGLETETTGLKPSERIEPPSKGEASPSAQDVSLNMPRRYDLADSLDKNGALSFMFITSVSAENPEDRIYDFNAFAPSMRPNGHPDYSAVPMSLILNGESLDPEVFANTILDRYDKQSRLAAEARLEPILKPFRDLATLSGVQTIEAIPKDGFEQWELAEIGVVGDDDAEPEPRSFASQKEVYPPDYPLPDWKNAVFTVNGIDVSMERFHRRLDEAWEHSVEGDKLEVISNLMWELRNNHEKVEKAFSYALEHALPGLLGDYDARVKANLVR